MMHHEESRADLVTHLTAPMDETGHPFRLSETLATQMTWTNLQAIHMNAHHVCVRLNYVDHP